MADLNASDQTGQTFTTKSAGLSVEDIYWGYIIRSGRRPGTAIMLAQGVSFFFGACLLSAAVGMLLLPTSMFDAGLGTMRMGAAVLFAAIALYLLWFASRGSVPELHVDTSTGEIREVIVNRVGRPSTVGCYGFDSIGGIFMEEDTETGMATLILRYRNTAQTVFVAEGTVAQLIPLRDRLGRDLMVDAKTGQSRAA